MKRFRQFLETKRSDMLRKKPKKDVKKKPLPKGVDLVAVSGDYHVDASGLPKLTAKDKTFWGKYISKMDDWLGGGEAAIFGAATFLLKHKDRIPAKFRKGGVFYRGIWFDEDYGFADLKPILKKNILTKRYKIASWTTKLEIARDDFARGTGGIGIVIEMKIPSSKVVLNMRDFVMARSTIEIGAATTTDDFGSMSLPMGEYEILVESFDVKLSDKNVVFAHWDNTKYEYSELTGVIERWEADQA